MVHTLFICQNLKKSYDITCLITLAFKVNRKLHSYSLLVQCDSFQVKQNIHAMMKKSRIWFHPLGIDLTMKSVRNSLNVSLQWIVENFWNTTHFLTITKVKGKTVFTNLLVTNFNFYFIKHLWKQTNACNGCQAVGKAVFLTPFQLLNTNTVSAAKYLQNHLSVSSKSNIICVWQKKKKTPVKKFKGKTKC